MTLANFLLHFKAKSTQLSLGRFEPDELLKHNNSFTSLPLVHSCVKVGKLLTVANFLLYPIFYFISSQKAHNSLQRDLNETKLLHFKSKSTQMSSAIFEPDQILTHNNPFTSVPLVHSCVKGGKLLTLPNFLLHFKSESTQMSSARFEPDKILIHNNPFTSVPLVHSRVMGGKLLTLANFLLHFKAKSTQLSLARFEQDQILMHNNAFTSVPLVHSCVKVGKLLSLPHFLLYPIFYFISSQKAHKSLQRDLNETKF